MKKRRLGNSDLLIEATKLELDGPSLRLLDEASAWREEAGAGQAS